mmetsp:Transcript_82707/g.246679  ORF Transcript_82707/g.246679 Transcript_82707/m.246679 type:complete len:225 (-) Transcript_82707:8-682(-)
MHSSEHSMTRQNLRRVFRPSKFIQASEFSRLRGKPSTKYLPPSQPCSLIACSTRPTVTSEGTSFPSLIRASMSSPISEPGRLRSALRRSPALRCLYPNCSTMRAEKVPLPHPGPPRTKTTSGPGGHSSWKTQRMKSSISTLFPLEPERPAAPKRVSMSPSEIFATSFSTEASSDTCRAPPVSFSKERKVATMPSCTGRWSSGIGQTRWGTWSKGVVGGAREERA